MANFVKVFSVFVLGALAGVPAMLLGLTASSSVVSEGGSVPKEPSEITVPVSTSTPTFISGTAHCQTIDSPIVFGIKNNPKEVLRLQNFLLTKEKVDVELSGIFDDKTLAAVKDFQKKYEDDILAPWGIKTPPGNVYLTTLKKINQLNCGASLVLTDREKTEIKSVKAKYNPPERERRGTEKLQVQSAPEQLELIVKGEVEVAPKDKEADKGEERTTGKQIKLAAAMILVLPAAVLSIIDSILDIFSGFNL